MSLGGPCLVVPSWTNKGMPISEFGVALAVFLMVRDPSVPSGEGIPHSPRDQRVQKSQPPYPNNAVVPHPSSLTKPAGKQFPSLF